MIPNMLRDYADLTKKLVLAGQGNKIELWSEDHWRERMQAWLESDAPALLADGDTFTGLSV